MPVWWWRASWNVFPLHHTMKCHLHKKFVIPCQCHWTTHHLLIPKCANSSSNLNLKGFGTQDIFYLMESYERGQAYQPLYESMNEHKISNKKKLHSYGYCTQAKKIKHWMTTLWGQKNNCLFWIQRLCEFQSCIAHNPLLEDLEIIAC